MPQPRAKPESPRAKVRTTYLIAQAYFALRTRTDSALKKHGVTGIQYSVLSVLVGRDKLSSAQLSRRFYVTPQSMGQLLTNLEESGLIERSEDPANRRILRVNLTQAGLDLVRLCDAEMKEIEQAAFAGLGPDDIASMRVSLQSIAERLRDAGESADA
jgi:DNA-binding MarR family transcriptional regulator